MHLSESPFLLSLSSFRLLVWIDSEAGQLNKRLALLKPDGCLFLYDISLAALRIKGDSERRSRFPPTLLLRIMRGLLTIYGSFERMHLGDCCHASSKRNGIRRMVCHTIEFGFTLRFTLRPLRPSIGIVGCWQYQNSNVRATDSTLKTSWLTVWTASALVY